MKSFILLSLRWAVEILLTLLEVGSATLLEAGSAILSKQNKIYYFGDEIINGQWPSEEE